MGLGEPPEAPPGAPARTWPREPDSLDLLVRHARQTRADERWRRQLRRRQLGATVVVLLVVLSVVGYVLRDHPLNLGAQGRPTPVTTLGSSSADQSAASSSAASVAPSASPSAAVSAPAASVRPAVASQAKAMYGKPASGLPWHSGFWTGGKVDRAQIKAAGTWRGRPMDFATVYPAYGTWSEIQNSDWAVSAFDGYPGRLAYGLPLLPKNRKGQWQDILSGKHDSTFRGIARLLVRHGHEDAAIRMGVEANGYWFPWAVTTDTTDEFKAAFVRIERVMSQVSPEFTFWLDLNCGTVLTGSTDRLAPLLQMYPGDRVVDGISMDHYNRYKLLAADEDTWQRAIAPSWAPGLRDGVDFARLHGKGFAVSEWGLDGVQGPGDSPYFMQKMFDFFTDSADVLVFENYFNEPDTYIAGGLFDSSQNPDSAALYRKLWGRKN